MHKKVSEEFGSYKSNLIMCLSNKIKCMSLFILINQQNFIPPFSDLTCATLLMVKQTSIFEFLKYKWNRFRMEWGCNPCNAQESLIKYGFFLFLFLLSKCEIG